MKTIYSIFLLLPIINFYFKIIFILLLFIFNLFLFYNKDYIKNSDKRELQSGFSSKNLRKFLTILGTLGGTLSALITIKNELKSVQIGKLDQLMETERVEIRKSIDKDTEEHQRILNSIENNREELFSLHIEKAKLLGHNDRLLTLHNSIKDNILSFKEKSTEPSIKLSDLGNLDQLIKQDTNKFGDELTSLFSAIENSYNEDDSQPTAGVSGESHTSGGINESVIFDIWPSLSKALEYFESLNGIKKLAVCLILGKYVILSALISIIFVFYGDKLIQKYNLENRYPKLAKLIQLRQKLQNYYFKLNCVFILIIIISEIIFSIAILLL